MLCYLRVSNKNPFFQTVGGALWFIYMYCLYNFESVFKKGAILDLKKIKMYKYFQHCSALLFLESCR